MTIFLVTPYAFFNEFLLGSQVSAREHIGFALFAHFHGLSRTNRNGFHHIASLFFKHRNQNVQADRSPGYW